MRAWVLLVGMVLVAVACGKGPGYGTLKATPQQPAPHLGGPILQGGNSSGGGDGFVSEFKKVAQDVVAVAYWKDTKQIEGVAIDALRDAVANTNIKTVEFEINHPDTSARGWVHPLCLEQDPNRAPRNANSFAQSHRVDAINCPDQKLIILSLVNWKSMELPEKRALVLHEYLGILKVVDQNNEPADRKYEKSYRILSHINLASTLRNNAVIGSIATVLISKIQWAASEVKSEEMTSNTGGGNDTFRFQVRYFKLEDTDKRVVLACESATGMLATPGQKATPVAPPAECQISHESLQLKSIRQVEFNLDSKAVAILKARLLPGKIKGISLQESSGGGTLTLDLLN